MLPDDTSPRSQMAIDLFSGCGGLSLGAELAGFEVALAVEKSPMAAMTHHRNFAHRDRTSWDPDHSSADHEEWASHLALSETDELGEPRDLLAQAKAGLVVGDMTKVVENEALLDHFREMQPALVAGGPPCQGFSMAGLRRLEDERNRLPGAFLRFVDAVQPRAVLVENVVGINRAFRKGGGEKAPFEELALALEQQGEGYVVQRVEVNARHFGVAQSRPRMMLIGLRRDIATKLGVAVTDDIWRSANAWADRAHQGQGDLSLHPAVGGRYPEAPDNEVAAVDVLRGLVAATDDTGYLADESHDQKHALARWLRWHQPEGVEAPRPLRNQRPRRHSSRVVERFALYRRLRDLGLNPGSLMRIGSEFDEREAVKRVANALSEAVLHDKKSLVEDIVRLSTKKHSQRALSLTGPSPTVLTLPDDHIHPEASRIMTVRELARLQSFPDWFQFLSKETTGGVRRRDEVPQYSQVGNAVPPVMAWAVLVHVRELLDEYDRRMQTEALE